MAGLFGVIGGKIGFLKRLVDFDSSDSGVPPSSVVDGTGSSPSSGSPAITRRIWERAAEVGGDLGNYVFGWRLGVHRVEFAS